MDQGAGPQLSRRGQDTNVQGTRRGRAVVKELTRPSTVIRFAVVDIPTMINKELYHFG